MLQKRFEYTNTIGFDVKDNQSEFKHLVKHYPADQKFHAIVDFAGPSVFTSIAYEAIIELSFGDECFFKGIPVFPHENIPKSNTMLLDIALKKL